MKVLFDITHPAHVHFFKNSILALQKGGHETLITSRHKDCTVELLDELGFAHTPLSSQNGGSPFAMARELLQRNVALYKIVKREKPDKLVALGGTSAAQIGFLTRTPSIIFYDTEDARLQNLLTYPFCTRIFVPECYQGWLPKRRGVRYPGFHELSYLAPQHFCPDKRKAIANGLDADRNNFFIRIVSWQASHDTGLKGWTRETLLEVGEFLGQHGKVIISSEAELPEALSSLAYTGPLNEVHHLLAFCRLYVGESATMASEAAVMGVPAIYAAPGFRGYVSHQEERFGMARFIREPTTSSISSACDEFLRMDHDEIDRRHQQMLSECVDVSQMITEILLDPHHRMPGAPQPNAQGHNDA